MVLLIVLVTACESPITQAEGLTDADAVALAMADNRDRQSLVLEFEGGDFTPGATTLGSTLGWAQLKRDHDDLKAVVHANGLKPGGVFTFWWVAVQDDATFPDDIFVALGAGAVIGQNGKATVHMTAAKGDPSIVGLPALGGALFGDLRDPEGALVRVEAAYHGQVEDAGSDLDQWLSDFWTGSACPTDGVNAAGQPHCPVYFAATHPAPTGG
jgi:hypothetical protein